MFSDSEPDPMEPAPMILCAACGADWTAEACDLGCPNDLDTAAKEEAATS